MKRSTKEKLTLKAKVEALIRERSDFECPNIIWRDDHLSTYQEIYDRLISRPDFRFDKQHFEIN